jgi:multimeric flavodoxin WrbA
MALTALGLNCSLKGGEQPSSTDLIVHQVLDALGELGVEPAGVVRIVDQHLAHGVSADEGPGDGWPPIRRRILDADILVFGTPIWLGHPASPAQMVLERLDAFISEADDAGRMPPVGKVALVAVVGNEDGAHHVGAELFQGLNDVGFTIPANGMTYWVGEAMQGVDLRDLPETPEKTRGTTRVAAANAAHLARTLASNPYPGDPGGS